MEKFFRDFIDYDFFEKTKDEELTEDAVREEVVAPLLKFFSYRATGRNKIHYSKKLVVPHTKMGTRKIQNIIPDYVLEVNGEYKFVLDAKATGKNIESGDFVYQAYSYAIHPEIRVNKYGLCNGRFLSIFHINKLKPTIYDIPNLDLKSYQQMCQNLSPDSIDINFESNLEDKNSFLPDAGIRYYLLGFNKSDIIAYPDFPLGYITKTEDNLYSIMATLTSTADQDSLFATIDLDKKGLEKILNYVGEEFADQVIKSFNCSPFFFRNEKNPPKINLICTLSENLIQSPSTGEEYMPFIFNDIFEDDSMVTYLDYSLNP